MAAGGPLIDSAGAAAHAGRSRSMKPGANHGGSTGSARRVIVSTLASTVGAGWKASRPIRSPSSKRHQGDQAAVRRAAGGEAAWRRATWCWSTR